MRVFKILAVLLFNFWYFYGIIYRRFPLLISGDTIIMYGPTLAIIFMDLYFAVQAVRHFENKEK